MVLGNFGFWKLVFWVCGFWVLGDFWVLLILVVLVGGFAGLFGYFGELVGGAGLWWLTWF